MLIFGHSQIPCPIFISIDQIAQIAQTPTNSVVYFHAHLENACELAQHCTQEQVKYAVFIENPLEWALMVNFKPSYLLVNHRPQDYQSLVNDYLLDVRILWVIDGQQHIEEALKMRMDGVIFKNFLSL
ncbi:hypothetical protein [Helicobacter cynogastricus]|uniref:hypothetical protein n=1 Tax=Helicobacter cynogastricus TaxID=329937 RepID=UPI0018F7F15C|nr:hypothetical protein [Helicobacter cynogastricus]